MYRSKFGNVEPGTIVAMSSAPSGAQVFTVTSGSQGGPSSGYYVHVINANSAQPGTYYVWIQDANGRAISDPNAGRVVTNNIKNPDDPASCWRAVVDFVRK